MMKFMKKAAAVLMVAVLLAGVYAPVASAEATKVVVHVQDGEAWGSMNVYDWGDKGELAGVWPGTEMTAEADGWYTYTFETEVNLNLVFSATGGSPQSGNVNDVSKDAGEIWVVIGGESGANDMGASTIAATLYTEPQEGWPTVAAVEEATAEDTAVEDTAAAETTTTEDTAVPKTGEGTPILAVALFALAAASAGIVVVLKKKEQTNEN